MTSATRVEARPAHAARAASRPALAASAALAAFACAPTPPSRHAPQVARALTDTLGCAIAATGIPAEALLRQWAGVGAGGLGRATVWTTGELTAPAQAALLNGTAAHALDWDDVTPGHALHPSAVLLPALLAAGEHTKASGARLLAAYDVGAAAFRALTRALAYRAHYGRGWHTTATVGRLAAVAALGNLYGLDERTIRHALGLATSLAGGSVANFGTMTKPLHVGLAARDAVMAVELAATGFTGNPDALEADGGFFALFGADDDGPDNAGVAERRDLGAALERWRTAWVRDWALKLYPSCYATHRAVHAALALRPLLRGEPPERVTVTVEPGGLRPLLDREPTTGAEAKFSMAYTVAVALTRGAPRLAHFADRAVSDELIRSTMRRISVGESVIPPRGRLGYGDGYAAVEIVYAGGRTRGRRVDRTAGDARSPLSDGEVAAKFEDCRMAAGMDQTTARRLLAALEALPTAESTHAVSLALRQRQGGLAAGARTRRVSA